jgi:hypothetical protein
VAVSFEVVEVRASSVFILLHSIDPIRILRTNEAFIISALVLPLRDRRALMNTDYQQ